MIALEMHFSRQLAVLLMAIVLGDGGNQVITPGIRKKSHAK